MPGEASEFARDERQRLEALERFVSQHGNSISTLVENQGALIRRVENLEALSHARAVTEAREDERDKALYSRLDRMESEIAGIKGIGTKALWIFGGAFLTALAAFIIKGGLV